MGLEFLARVRRTTLWLGAIASLLGATYLSPSAGLAVLLGAAWSLVNLFLIEKLVVAATGSDRNSPRALARAATALGGMILLFVAGALMLMRLSPLALAAGFTIHIAVITLKAASLLVLPSRFWQRLTASRWRGAAVLSLLVLGAWLALGAVSPEPGKAGAQGSTAPGVPAADTIAQHLDSLGAPAVEHASDTTLTGVHGSIEPGAAAADGEHGGEAHGGGGGPEKFPNVITVLARLFPDAEWAHFLHGYEAVVYSMFVALLLCVVALVAVRSAAMIPGPLQNVVEMVVETLNDFVLGILGPKHGPRYVPFLGTLFVYILTMNLLGIIPFMDSPTSSLNVTVALALVVFLYSQYIGFRELGVVGYFDHMMGSPRTMIGWLLVPLMLPIHLMGEIAKPISLAARLFGNIFGEDMLLVAFATLGITVLSFTHLPLGLPLHLPFLFLALLTSTLQALVFTVLSTIYFLLMLPHEEHGHEAEAAHAH